MKLYLFVYFIMALFSESKAQGGNELEVIKLPQFYKEKGIIFSKTYSKDTSLIAGKNRYTPTLVDIIQLEKILLKKFNLVTNQSVELKIYFNCWVRRYIGFIDSEGQKNVIVNFINNKNPQKVKKLLGKDWGKDFFMLLSDDFYAVSKIYRVNIDAEEIYTNL